MWPLLAIVGIYLLYQSGGLVSLGISAPVSSVPPQLPNPSPYQVGGGAPLFATAGGGLTSDGTTKANVTGLLVSGAATVGSAAAAAPASFVALGLSGAAAGAALAGIGAVAAIAVALLMAHEQRKKQATSENSAVVLGVAGFDSDLRQVNQAYNSRQIDAAGAISLVNQIMAHYWQLVTPMIQPGRNGCGGGGSCPPWPIAGNGCSGNIGAACCVGCYDLAGGTTPTMFPGQSQPLLFGAAGTIQALRLGGGVVFYQEVFGSKYGGKDRPSYLLHWQQSSLS